MIVLTLLGLAVNLVQGLDVKCEQNEDVDYKEDPRACYIRHHIVLQRDDRLNFTHALESEAITTVKFIDVASPIFLPNIFTKFQNLEVFDLDTEVQELSEGDFKNANSLKRLVIRKGLKAIPAKTLGDLKKLEVISVDHNQISDIEDNAFEGLDNLLVLDLSFNQLNIIKMHTFVGLKKLAKLDLRFNKISRIEDGSLKLPSLVSFSLSHNRNLKLLSDTQFVDTPALETVFLDGCQLKSIPESLYGLQNVQSISFNSNNISEINFSALSSLPELRTLTVALNNLQSVNTFSQVTKQLPRSELSHLSVDYDALSNRDILNSLAVFNRLEQLNIVDEKLNKVNLDQWKIHEIFPALKTIYLSLMEIDSDWLKSFSKEFEAVKIRIVRLD